MNTQGTKYVNLLAYAYHLTGDSKIDFYLDWDKTLEKFGAETNAIFIEYAKHDIGFHKDNHEDYFYKTEEGGIRFYGGQHEAYDNLHGDVDMYIVPMRIEIPENATHYLASFSEHVDQFSVVFGTLEELQATYDEKVAENIEAINYEHNVNVSRSDDSTWKEEDYIFFAENETEEGGKEAYANLEVSETVRLNPIPTERLADEP